MSNPTQQQTSQKPAVTHARASSQQPATQQLICDFSSMFKRKGSYSSKPPKLGSSKTAQQSKSPNWLLQIPTKLQITLDDIQKRRTINQSKWMSITKVKNTKLKIIAAIASCYNYISLSKNGKESKNITVQQLLELIKQDIVMEEVLSATQWDRYSLIERILQSTNKNLTPKLQCRIVNKLSKPNQNPSSANQQKQSLLSSLSVCNPEQSSTLPSCHIYLAYNDIFVPVGFDITPLKQLHAYQKIENIKQEDTQLWIINSSLGANQPTFSIKRYADIQTDMKTQWPYFIDIKEAKLGVRLRPEVESINKKQGVQQKEEQKQQIGQQNKQVESTKQQSNDQATGVEKKQIIGADLYNGGNDCIVQITIINQQ